MGKAQPTRLVTIACGGTGGHLFPGVAVAEALERRGADVELLISSKAVDQLGVQTARHLEVLALPALPPSLRSCFPFLKAFLQSCRVTRTAFKQRRPVALLAMGGFASAPSIVAARMAGVPVFLHEANSVPGRANRWCSPLAREVYLYFPGAAANLRHRSVHVTGMPVRSRFQPSNTETCRKLLKLDASAPVLLVTGGSQGAHALNKLLEDAVGLFAVRAPELQFVHFTGSEDAECVRRTYARHGRRAVVEPFCSDMWTALGAATLAVARAGASSLAEQAAMRLPAILIPYPHAADNHQHHNALAFAATGAARLLPQNHATPNALVDLVLAILLDPLALSAMQTAMVGWHRPDAAEWIAERLIEAKQSPTRAADSPLTIARLTSHVGHTHADGSAH